MKKRIIGIDIARALAIIGMIIVNFKVVMGDQGTGSLKTIASFFDGKAAATFVVLAGVGLALMTNTPLQNNDPEKIKAVRIKVIKRALLLFFIGLSYLTIWPADILHFYGIYFLVALLFLTSSKKTILWSAIAMIVLYPILFSFWNYETGWDFATLEYHGFWTIKGFLRNLFYNGFHPVLPWTAFMLFGVWFGKQDLKKETFIRKALRFSSLSFLSIQLLSWASISWFTHRNQDVSSEINILLGTDPMPPLPLYMLSGVTFAITVISLCILAGNRFPSSKVLQALNKTGQLALTFYILHVVVGMGVLDAIAPDRMGTYSIQFSLMYALAFSLLCIAFATIWRKYQKSGPLEYVFRKLTE